MQKVTKKEIKKKIREYESQRNLLRKVHYEGEGKKKKREKTVED